MDFLEDLWILLLLPPLLSAALSTATHNNIFGNSKLEADGERSREDLERVTSCLAGGRWVRWSCSMSK